MIQQDLSFDRLRILVIEDRKETRVMIKAMLTDMGISQIFEASDGREGLEFFDVASDMVDMILCDWQMPNMDGFQLLQQVRTVNPSVPFLMITGKSDMQSVIDARAAKVSAYIRKPFSLNQLEAKLRIIHQKQSVVN